MKKTSNGKFTIGTDGENFYNSYETKEEAIAEGRDLYEGRGFYIGETTSLKFESSDIHLTDVLCDDLVDRLSDEVGETADGWEPSKEDWEKLEEMLAITVLGWLEKENLQPNMYSVDNVEHIEADTGGEEE